MPLSSPFASRIQNINRVREIIAVLLKYGFDEVVSSTALGKLVPYSSLINPPDAQAPRADRIRRAIEELGPTFIKLAQILSNRPDLIPNALLVEFQKLQSEVPPFSFEAVQRIVEAELGRPLDEVFKYLSQKPIGAASIGQVHKGKLRTGEMVAVKVQRPAVRELIETDIALLKFVIKRSERYIERQGLLNPMEIVEVFERTIQRELDYRTEARHLQQFKRYYAEQEGFYVPVVYPDFCTERVLTLEHIYGCKITDIKTLHSWGLDPQAIAVNGLDVYLSQIFEHGLFHADPHPGNIIIQSDGRLCLIDFGMVGKLTKSDKYHLAGIFMGMAQQDARRMTVSLQQLAIDAQIENIRALEMDLAELIEEFSGLEVGDTHIGAMAQRLQQIFYDYRLRMPPNVYLIFRALTILDGIAKEIYPDFQFYEFLKPYGARIFKEQFSPKNIRDNSLASLLQLFSIFNNLPFDTKEIITQIKKGRLHIQVELQGYGQLLTQLQAVFGQLGLSVIAAALFVASALLLPTDIGTRWLHGSVLGWLLLLGAVLLLGLLVVRWWWPRKP